MPGIRPGKPTTDYLNRVLVRITLIGGVFLGLVAVMPGLVSQSLHITSLRVGGTSVLIVVSVVLEMTKQLESMLITRNYEVFARK